MSKKTEYIYARTGNHTLLQNNKARIIGYKVGFNSQQQIKRFTGGGCIIPGIVCFYYDRMKECADTFYFEDGVIAYMTVQLQTEPYLCDVYTKCIKEKCNESEFIECVADVYTMRMMGF